MLKCGVVDICECTGMLLYVLFNLKNPTVVPDKKTTDEILEANIKP